jgi:Response regulators consisting of a CheY-like receiver domain and a winged-helix DNA-binding domain
MVNLAEPKPNVLVVDDEESNCIVFVRALQLMGYDADSAGNGRLALEKLQQAKFDVMLLDLKMPEMDGEAVLDSIRSLYPNLGVIVLTAHATLESAISAVKAGAVDYLLKPQKITEIEAAIQRALKRREAARQKETLVSAMEQALSLLKDTDSSNAATRAETASFNFRQVGRLLLDPEQRLVTVLPLKPGSGEARKAVLTEVQFAILLYLTDHPQKVIDSHEIAARVLGYSELSTLEAERLVRPHILRLRRKLEDDPEAPQFIRSVRGRGYCFSA